MTRRGRLFSAAGQAPGPRLHGPPRAAEFNSPRSSGICGMRERTGCLDLGRGAGATSSLLWGSGEAPAQEQMAPGSHVPRSGLSDLREARRVRIC